MRIWLGFLLPGPAILARNPFKKPALGLPDLAILLASRGLIFDDWAGAHEHLEHIGYYRLTGYLHQFKVAGPATDADSYLPNTTFESVHDRYIFDRRLRLLILEAVEKIEIAARVSISDSMAASRSELVLSLANLRPFTHNSQRQGASGDSCWLSSRGSSDSA
jgi:abortive infection bacteriophage resistance protein